MNADTDNCHTALQTIKNLPVPVFLLTKSTMKIRDANAAMATQMGSKVQDLLGKPFFDIFSGLKDRPECNQDKSPQKCVIRTLLGEKKNAEIRCFSVEDEDLLGVILLEREELVRAEGRIMQMESMLEALRNIRSFAARESDTNRLLDILCNDLVRSRGYRSAWVALLDDDNHATAFAESGLGILPMEEDLRRGSLCYCARKALEVSGLIIIEDTLATCGDCPLSSIFGQSSGLTIRIEFAGRNYGVLNVHAAKERAAERSEQQLLLRIAQDIAMLLHNLETEKARRQAEEDIEYAKRVRSDFLQLTVHQLRTPMTPLREGLSILQEELAGGLTDEQKSILSVAMRNAERLDHTISGLIKLQRITGGLETFSVSETDPDILLEEISLELTRNILLKNLEMVQAPHGNLEKSLIDKDKIILAFTLLAKVVLNYTPSGKILLYSGKDGKMNHLGIDTKKTNLKPEEQIMFYRETSTSFLGRSMIHDYFLDLSICREIAKLHQGYITAEENGEGISVRLHFPEKHGAE